MKRRFEKGRIWWEIDVLGNVVSARTSAGEERKTYATPKLAEAEAEKRIWTKRALGYAEAGAAPAPVKAAPKKAPLEPVDEPPSKTVLGRGETDSSIHREVNPNVTTYLLAGQDLITVVATQRVTQSFDSASDAKEHLARVTSLRLRDGYRVLEKGLATEDELKGPPPEDKTVEIRPSENGMWQLTFKSGTEDVAAQSCAHAISELERAAPRAVVVRCDLKSPGTLWSEGIAGRALPSVECFVLDTDFQTVTRQAENSLGDLSATFEAMPNLKRAFLSGDLQFTRRLRCEQLEEITLQGSPLNPGVVTMLHTAHLPKLERLTLGLASESTSLCTDAEAADAVVHSGAKEVFVDGLRDLAAFLRQLGERGVPPALRSLMLGGGTNTEEDDLVTVLTQHAAAFANVNLALRIEDLLTEDAESRMRAKIPKLTDLEDAHELLLPQAYSTWGDA